MLTSLLIGVTLALFGVWFRYTCVLILKAKPARDYSLEVASANELKFLEVQQSLACIRERGDLDTLQRHLVGDYRLLTYILRHGAQFQIGASRMERRILMLDFELTRLWYALTCRLSAAISRKSLQEMISIIAHLANFMGERAVARAD